MPDVKLLKDPGYLQDLFCVFYLKFNYKLFTDALPDDSSKAEKMKFFSDISEQFSDIPEDLFVFFHAPKNNRCFMTTYYFDPFVDRFTTDYDFRFVQNEISDRNKLIRSLIRFYLYDLSDDEMQKCIESNAQLFDCIKKTDYTAEEKSRLYEFFINPEPYILTLQYELMTKEIRLSQYYEMNYQKIIDTFNQTSFEVLYKRLGDLHDLKFLNEKDQTFYTSYCLINKYCMYFMCIREGALYLLGYDYMSVINFVKDRKKEVNLEGFGSAVGEESRVNILKLLAEKGEATCKDLEKAFSFSGSTAYHHLTVMLKANLIKTRNEGKTIYYSINKPYFASVADVLKEFAGE